jgi:hypothetical protein
VGAGRKPAPACRFRGHGVTCTVAAVPSAYHSEKPR